MCITCNLEASICDGNSDVGIFFSQFLNHGGALFIENWLDRFKNKISYLNDRMDTVSACYGNRSNVGVDAAYFV